jgi:hypothetical protein
VLFQVYLLLQLVQKLNFANSETIPSSFNGATTYCRSERKPYACLNDSENTTFFVPFTQASIVLLYLKILFL